MRWKIVYVDGTTFGNMDGEPEDAPGGRVLAVAQADAEVGLLVHYGTKYYLFGEEFGGWTGADELGFAQYVIRPGLKIVKIGDNMSTERYRQMMADLRRDPNLPKKSARYPWESP